eukprot:363309-Chlamydomonas_euryale.AAC.36
MTAGVHRRLVVDHGEGRPGEPASPPVQTVPSSPHMPDVHTTASEARRHLRTLWVALHPAGVKPSAPHEPSCSAHPTAASPRPPTRVNRRRHRQKRRHRRDREAAGRGLLAPEPVAARTSAPAPSAHDTRRCAAAGPSIAAAASRRPRPVGSRLRTQRQWRRRGGRRTS